MQNREKIFGNSREFCCMFPCGFHVVSNMFYMLLHVSIFSRTGIPGGLGNNAALPSSAHRWSVRLVLLGSKRQIFVEIDYLAKSLTLLKLNNINYQ